MKLDKLTPEQEKLMFQTSKEWIDRFFETKIINEKEFEKGIKWLYGDLLKKKYPKIIYCESWIEALLTISTLKKSATMGDTMGAKLRDTVGDTVRATVGDTVRDTVGDTVRATVRDTVGDTVRATVGATVRATVRDTVGATVGGYSGYISTFSNFGWVSYYDYFEKIGLFSNNDFRKYKDLINAGAFQVYEYENYVFAIQPPKTILRNESGLLNSIEKKAFEWSDGVGFYYVNGIEIKEGLFIKLKNKQLTIEDFVKEPNEEIKSSIIAFIQQRDGEEGIYRFFSKNLKEIDSFVDKKEQKYLEGTTRGMNVGVYTLFKGEINNTDVAYIRCFCPSTDRMFFLGVEPKYLRAKDAIASLYQVPKELEKDIVSICRQGEMFSTTFTEEATKKLKNKTVNINEYVSISGDRYFQLIKYEY